MDAEHGHETLLRWDEEASVIDCKISTLRGWVRQRRVPHLRLGARKLVRFRRRDLLEWLDQQAVPTVKQAGSGMDDGGEQ